MEEIYEKYSKLVYNYLYTLTHNIELSEELMQETFYSAIKGINSFRNECNISVWLCQIAKNKWKRYLVKNKKIKEISIDINSENMLIDTYIEDELDNKNQIEKLYKKIQTLDQNSQEVFYLKLRGELTFKEIGEILGKSEEWTRITFYRGKIKLKEEFKNYE